MAKQRTTPPQIPVQHDTYSRIEAFGLRYKNILIGAFATILVIFLAVFAFRAFYIEPNEREAQAQMFRAQMYFEMDSFNLALHGDANYPGFLDIIRDYKWTPSANLAHYYAGISFLRLGNYQAAVDFLSDYRTKDGVVGTVAYGSLGDAYMELGNTDRGIRNYKKAADHFANDFTTPIYLLRAGQALEMRGDYSDAKRYYERIRENFSETPQGRDVERYIARVEAQMQIR